jgi:pyruvate/2-oxoglutarate dehydrogenase complex dihydrolipoamide dehydrogenase (E3) component
MKKYQIAVIGAGAAGLVVAIGAAMAGKKALIIDKGPFGGDCTNFGCIPSKALIASAKAASFIKTCHEYGLHLNDSNFQADEVLNRVHSLIEEVRSHGDANALEKKGVHTLTGEAKFESNQIINVNVQGQMQSIYFESAVIATGSSPKIPFIDGLLNTPFKTNVSIFNLKTIPKSLAIIGGGPIGCELGQAFQRLGTQVSIIHNKEHLLDKEDVHASHVIARQFEKEGVKLFLNQNVKSVYYANNEFILELNEKNSFKAEQLLVATGHKPHISSLNLDTIGVQYGENGILVDAYGRTTTPHIWAVGDCIGQPFYSHAAEHQARAVLSSFLNPFFNHKLANQSIPRITFTDPEVASIGLSEYEAKEKYGTIATYQVPFTSIDRGITTGRTDGFVKIITKKWSSHILGATLVGEGVGELLSQISTAMYMKIPLRKLANVIHPYPSYSLAIRHAADLWIKQTILPLYKKIFK